MILRTKILTILLFFSAGVFAQELSVVSMFDQNLIYYNPGATGSQEVFTASFFYRSQWTGMDGAPSTQFFSMQSPLKNTKDALGLTVSHESIGSNNYIEGYANYGHRFIVGPGKISLGLKIGFFHGSQRMADLREGDDPLFNSDKNGTFTILNAGFGALYYTDQYWVSFSIPGFFGFESDPSGKYKMSHELLNYTYYFGGGGKIALPAEFSLEPSVLMAYSAVNPFKLSINAIAMYKNSIRAGLGFRNGYRQAIILHIGYNINRQFALAYSYDFSIGKSSGYNSGSHEISIQYKFGYKVNASNPRGF